MQPLLVSLGRRLRALRFERGFTVRDVAGRSGLSTRFLTELETGRANVSVLRLDAVARSLGTTVGALLREAEATVPLPPVVIAALGIRGAGKSTIGAELARRLAVPFVELDREVETEAGLSLAEVFAVHGEGYYRRLECRVLERILDRGRSLVLATGGGIVSNPPAFTLLDRRAFTVWLRASAKDYWDRVVRQGDRRPMSGNPTARAELRRLVAQREPLYAPCRCRIETSRLGVARSVEAILEALRAASPPAHPAERDTRQSARRPRGRLKERQRTRP
jgi:XRE family aerobic/anaerobic benzoate catabolism transcriptional regulator